MAQLTNKRMFLAVLSLATLDAHKSSHHEREKKPIGRRYRRYLRMPGRAFGGAGRAYSLIHANPSCQPRTSIRGSGFSNPRERTLYKFRGFSPCLSCPVPNRREAPSSHLQRTFVGVLSTCVTKQTRAALRLIGTDSPPSGKLLVV
jgi:hypothetical protein